MLPEVRFCAQLTLCIAICDNASRPSIFEFGRQISICDALCLITKMPRRTMNP